MNLTKTEKIAILLTALFLVFTAGLHAGLGQSGDGLYISQAAPVESAGEKSIRPHEDAPELPVNINTADAQELMLLAGIGEKLAARIIAYREENGAFERPEDITLVPGIADGIYSKICTDIVT